MTEVEALRGEVAAAARRLAAAGLLIGTAGNISVLDPATGNLVITATGAVLAECEPGQVSVVTPDGAVVVGDWEPSSEFGLHRAAFERRDVGAVVHTHAPAATAVSCVRESLPVIHYQQLLLGGEIAVARYETFGSPELAAAVSAALDGRSAALMANHGAVTTGSTLAKAVENALLLEWCCRLLIDSTVLGPPRFLDEAAQMDVIAAALARNYGTTRPATAPATAPETAQEN